MSALGDLFGPKSRQPRAKPRVLMQIDDNGMFPDGRTCGHFVCRRCGQSDWLAATFTELRRGLPCPTCNTPPARAVNADKARFALERKHRSAVVVQQKRRSFRVVSSTKELS